MTPVRLYSLLLLGFLVPLLTACTFDNQTLPPGHVSSYVVWGKRYHVLDSAQGFIERGIASWYGEKFHGRKTASGEVYNMYDMTAAHKSLPLSTHVYVKNLSNGKSVVVKVNDRGPFIEGRIIDLSYAAAQKLGVIGPGTANVEIRAMPDTAVNSPLFIQVASFRNKVNAENMARTLKTTQKMAVSVKPHKIGEDRFYRVWIGPVEDSKKADLIILSLNEKGFSSARIVTQE